jgi:hypothetical protein
MARTAYIIVIFFTISEVRPDALCGAKNLAGAWFPCLQSHFQKLIKGHRKSSENVKP